MSESWPAAIAAGWHPIASVSQLRGKPLSRTLMGTPLVVFKGTTGPIVLVDRCPHRAMPLSLGCVDKGAIACPYHGWHFAEEGRCTSVPGSDTVPTVSAEALPTVVRAGLVWTSLAKSPAEFPEIPGEMEDSSLDSFWWAVEPSQARPLDALENHLDPAHPHFLHPWIVRSPRKRRKVRVKIRLGPKGGQAVYYENATASAWMPRLLEGPRMRSIGRYFPPLIGQILFENDKGLSLAVSVVFSPEDHDRTRPFAHFATPVGSVPAWIKRLVLKGFHIPVLRQDQRALAQQAKTIARFEDANFAVGPLDFLGPTIWRLANDQEQRVVEREEIIEL